jgi:hypothetical protein
MNQQLALLALIYSFLTLSMEQPFPPVFPSKKLSAEQAIELNSAQQQKLLSNPVAHIDSKTPALDTYKCAYILGALKPQGVAKIKRKIPEQLGALVAQKKHQGKTLSPSEELELLKWQTHLAQKYSQPHIFKENKT